jgi:hypothetical protein
MLAGAESRRRSIGFAGRWWWVKQAGQPVGPGPNRFGDSSDSVRVNAEGHLVLTVRRAGGHWMCAEVAGEETTGYGRYEWTLSADLTDLQRHVVLGMFAWSDEPDQSNREIDIEVSAWGRGDGVIGQFVVQPSGDPGHRHPFTVPSSASWRCWFDWSPDRISFAAADGQRWTFAGAGVPTPRGVHPRINLWLDRGIEPDVDRAVAVTVGEFRFTPHAAPVARPA